MLTRSLLFPLALLVSAPVVAQDKATEAPAAQIDVPDFHGVSVGHGLRAEVKTGAKSVRLEGSKADVERIKLKVKDGVLTTQVDGGSWFSRGVKGVKLYITTPSLDSVEASGGAHLEAQATSSDTFEAEASGGSHVSVTGVDAKTLEVEASGGATLAIEGRTGALKVEASGGSVIEAGKVKAESLEVEGSGGSQIRATGERSIEADLSGGSTVTSSTKPARVEVNSSGGSQVRYESP